MPRRPMFRKAIGDLQMHEYEVRIIVEGHNTKVRVQAYSSIEAKRIALAQFGGKDARAIETKEVR